MWSEGLAGDTGFFDWRLGAGRCDASDDIGSRATPAGDSGHSPGGLDYRRGGSYAAWCGRAGRPRPRHAAAAPTAASCRDAAPGQTYRLSDDAQPGSARGLVGRTLDRRPGRLEHAADFNHAARAESAGVDALGPGFHRQVLYPGQVRRLRELRRAQSEEADPRAKLLVSRLAERRLGLPEPRLHVVRGHEEPQ